MKMSSPESAAFQEILNTDTDSINDDMFALSDEENHSPNDEGDNPIEESLIKQLEEVNTRIDRTTTEINNIDGFIQKALDNWLSIAINGESTNENSDVEVDNIQGIDIVKKKKSRITRKTLIVIDIWQKVIDSKWVIGIVLQNVSRQVLTDLRLYVKPSDRDESQCASRFWVAEEEVKSIDRIEPGARNIHGVVALEQPNFERDSKVEFAGVVAYAAAGYDLQTPFGPKELDVNEIVDETGQYALHFTSDAQRTEIALRSTAIESPISVNLQSIDDNRGSQFLTFIANHKFIELRSDVYANKINGPLLYCLMEVGSVVDRIANLRIYARSEIQFSLLMRLLKNEFPEEVTYEDEERLYRGAIEALLEECETYLADSTTSSDIARARLRTDLLLPA